MRKLAILHFNPIELYPPVLNLLNFLAGKKDKIMEIRVFSRYPNKNQAQFETDSPYILINRIGDFQNASSVARYGGYFKYYWNTTRQLAKWKPDQILYYETISAAPAIFHKKSHDNCKLFIHYHEYTSPGEYEHGMIINKWQHSLEKKIYFKTAWISHTNKDRIQLFIKDNERINLPAIYELPNYPPEAWQRAARKKRHVAVMDLPVKVVYAGALSMDSMYTREFAHWVVNQQGRVVWDIFSANITEDALSFFRDLNSPFISIKGSIDYYLLPEALTNYSVGVVLYKGHIPNYVYNAPNKLFEYVCCGLDAWFPKGMKSSLHLLTAGTYPKVIALDFTQLDSFNFEAAINRIGFQEQLFTFNCEDAFAGLYHAMTA